MISRKDVYTCDMCKTNDFMVEGSYESPLEWLTIRISSSNTCAGENDWHLCPSCKYNDVQTLWEKI